MRFLISRLLKPGSFGRWVVAGFFRHPVRFFASLFRSAVATKKLTGSFYPIRVKVGVGQKLNICMGKNSVVKLVGTLKVEPWGGSTVASSISCGDNCLLTIGGDFEIGPDVHIQLERGAKLSLGGRRHSSASGITCSSRIMVEKSVEIGIDCIIAWDVFISDSDWHNIAEQNRVVPVSIGDHCWISHGVSILKGSVIPSGCIVGAKSLVSSVFEAERALIAGLPARVIKNGVEWSR